jgi:hypothetical protein
MRAYIKLTIVVETYVEIKNESRLYILFAISRFYITRILGIYIT